MVVSNLLVSFALHDTLLITWQADTLMGEAVLAADVLPGSSPTERLFQES